MGRWEASDCAIDAWIPQGWILGGALFLLYISDLPDDALLKLNTVWQMWHVQNM